MMESLARQLVKKRVAWAIVIATLVCTALGGWQATKVDQDDDVLKFLPQGNADVAQFRAINERFGGLDVAMVGLEPGDPFDAAFLAKLRALTESLNQETTIAYSLSLANVEDYAKEKSGGISTDELVSALPANDAEKAALRARVMSKDYLVGTLISADGKSILVYNFGKHGTSPRALAAVVKRRFDDAFPDLPKYWGGAPFVSTYIYDITQADVRRLTPWAILVKLLIVIIAFRHAGGVGLTVAAAGIGIVIAEGLMGASRVSANVVLGSLPVILFALGSAYVTHIVVHYLALRAKSDPDEAIIATMKDVGPPVLGAGLITAAGLFSFLAMDVQPLRQFGTFAGIGILVTLTLSLTFVPAVLALTRPGPKAVGTRMTPIVGRFAALMNRRRMRVTLVLGAVAAAGAFLTSQVEARMESSAFFAKDSPPGRAERFLRDHFGGSQFIQIAVDGDMNDPEVLREVERVGDEISLLPHVSSVTHIGDVLAMTGDAMYGERRVPAKTSEVLPLYRFLAGRASVRQLVTEEETPGGAVRQHAVVIVKIDSDGHDEVGQLLAQIEALIGKDAIHGYRLTGDGPADAAARDERVRQVVTANVRALLHSFGTTVPAVAAFSEPLALPAPKPDKAAVEARLATLIALHAKMPGKHRKKPLDGDDLVRWAAAIAREATALGPAPDDHSLTAAIAKATGARADGDDDDDDNDSIEDLADSVGSAVDEAWRPELTLGRARQLLERLGVTLPEGDKGARLLDRVADALLDLGNRGALVPDPAAAGGRIAYSVSGVPVLNRGLSQSVRANQFKSLAMSLGLVLLIMIALYRSLSAGLLAVAPTALTLLVIYGAMRLLGLHLEIGTSMLASLIIGAGVDYGVHLLAAWRADDGESLETAAARAAEHSGFGSWTNAVMVSAGFFVLTLGQARPLKTVGGLTGAAMLVAALCTFVVIPALARRRRYTRARALGAVAE